MDWTQFFIIFILITLYAIPTLLGLQRNQEKIAVIFIVNLALGWSVIFWIYALYLGYCGDETWKRTQKKRAMFSRKAPTAS